jgi:hypothetical protein
MSVAHAKPVYVPPALPVLTTDEAHVDAQTAREELVAEEEALRAAEVLRSVTKSSSASTAQLEARVAALRAEAELIDAEAEERAAAEVERAVQARAALVVKQKEYGQSR